MAQHRDHPGAPDEGAPSRRKPRGRRRADTRDPRRSRERALKILFQADVRGEPADALLARIVDDPRAWVLLDELDPEAAGEALPDETAEDDGLDEVLAAKRRKHLELDGFTRSLVQGVADHQGELDELVQRFARRWTVARMPAIDRNLLRLGTYELAHEVTSPAVVINEVIELAKRLSTEDSGRYVNGVLEAIRRHLAAEQRHADAEPVADGEPQVVDVPEPDVSPEATAGGVDEPAAADVIEVVEVGDDLEPSDELLEEPPTDPDGEVHVLPPPNEEGDAVDLLAEPSVDSPDDDLVDEDIAADIAADVAADVDEDLFEVEGPAGADEDGSDVPEPGAGQQQLF
jgi:transcription antitermination factor NusB